MLERLGAFEMDSGFRPLLSGEIRCAPGKHLQLNRSPFFPSKFKASDSSPRRTPGSSAFEYPQVAR
ncbi:hypothetical protein, partial [Dyella sp.]|uniref:hypothetical protein n=1 Tax=Dyella sp. TaxID=1869338 RepID=UPI002B46125C